MIRRIESNVCIGCGICETICPGDVIAMMAMEEGKKAQVKHLEDCWTCFSCEMSCPVKAIYVHPFRKVKPMAW